MKPMLFASAFLLPARAFSREFKSETFSWDHMFHLKARWKVSLAAMIVRAYGLGLLDAFMYRRAFKYLSARKWRKREPEEPRAQEPELLEESLKSLYLELGEHPLQVCKRLHFRPSTFSELTGSRFPSHGRRSLSFDDLRRTYPSNMDYLLEVSIKVHLAGRRPTATARSVGEESTFPPN